MTATLASQSLDSNAALGNIDLGYKYHWRVPLPDEAPSLAKTASLSSHVRLARQVGEPRTKHEARGLSRATE